MRHSSKRSHWLAALSVLLVALVVVIAIAAAVCTENLIRVDDVMESPKLAQ
jgi:hypothetical protein